MSEKLNRENIRILGPVEQAKKLRTRTSFGKAFVVLGKFLVSEEPEIREIAHKALKEALQNIANKNGEDNMKGVVDALVPVLIRGLSDINPNIRQGSLRAIAEIAKKCFKLESNLPAIAARLKDEKFWVARSAALALEQCAIKCWDLTPVMPALDEVLSGKSASIRFYASKAVSKHLQNKKEEAPLEVHREVAKRMSSCWSILVSHRRMWAKIDTPLKGKTGVSWHICGVCASENLEFIGYHWDCGTGWKFLKYEYHCKDCGNYTLYSYDD